MSLFKPAQTAVVDYELYTANCELNRQVRNLLFKEPERRGKSNGKERDKKINAL
jgi:hypothetical protein